MIRFAYRSGHRLRSRVCPVEEKAKIEKRHEEEKKKVEKKKVEKKKIKKKK